MTKGIRDIGIVIVVALSFLGSAQQRAKAQSPLEDEEAIRHLIAGMDEAFNAHKPDTALFTRDADFINVNGTWLRGASEIERGRRAAFETRLKNATTRSVEVRIRFIRPDVAIANVISETAGVTTSDGRELPAQRELNIRVLTKEHGQWLVTAFQNTPLHQ